MQKHEFVLAALSAGDDLLDFSPVQVQKLFFLLDREIPGPVGGPHFAFEPYDFGPFDKEVYRSLDLLQLSGLAKVGGQGRFRRYYLTPEGFEQGQQHLETLPREVRLFISELAKWVRSLSFSQLVSSIYQHYPEMRAKSIFQQ